MPKLDVYTLGEKGVNVVKSPIHLEDGELTSAQNAIFNPDKAAGGICKRGGLPRLNSSALNGAVKGIFGVPLPDPDDATTTYWAGELAGETNKFLKSSDGVTWAENSALDAYDPVQPDKFYSSVQASRKNVLGFANRLYWIDDGFTQDTDRPFLMCYDGTNIYKAFTPPDDEYSGNVCEEITCMTILAGSLYLGTREKRTGAYAGRVFRYNLSTGVWSKVGNTIGAQTGETGVNGFIQSIIAFGSRIWVGINRGAGSAGAAVFHIEPNTETTWTTSSTGLGAGLYAVSSFASYHGVLYAGTTALVGTNAAIFSLAAGSWQSARTGATTTANNQWAPMCVFNDQLWAVWIDYSAGTRAGTIDVWDGSSWTQSLDIDSSLGAANVQRAGDALVTSTQILIPFLSDGVGDNGYIYLYTVAGGWTQTATGIDPQGGIGKLVVP